jgi:hypothetical protein
MRFRRPGRARGTSGATIPVAGVQPSARGVELPLPRARHAQSPDIPFRYAGPPIPRIRSATNAAHASSREFPDRATVCTGVHLPLAPQRREVPVAIRSGIHGTAFSACRRGIRSARHCVQVHLKLYFQTRTDCSRSSGMPFARRGTHGSVRCTCLALVRTHADSTCPMHARPSAHRESERLMNDPLIFC